MPQVTKNAPDAHDTYNMCAAIAEEFGLIVEFTCHYYADYVQVIARARTYKENPEGEVTHQALTKYRYGTKTAREQLEYGLAFDLWCQCDGMGATAAKRGPTYQWNGRLEKIRRRTAQ